MKIEITSEGYWTAPDGSKWRLVPVEADGDHIMSGTCLNVPYTPGTSNYAANIYRKMIEAAPPPPATQSRYDWSKIPEGYDWAATDENGEVWAFPEKPKTGKVKSIWINFAVLGAIKIETDDTCPDWRESLERRP